MDEKEKIMQWHAPIWHSDFGDSKLELQILRSLCLHMAELNRNYTFNLHCIEDGYMYVSVIKFKSPIMEVCINSEGLISLFFENGDEINISSVDEIDEYVT